MGDVADLRPMWKAPDEAIDAEPPAFESFFEEQKERLLRILSVITGSRAEAEDLERPGVRRRRRGALASGDPPDVSATQMLDTSPVAGALVNAVPTD